MNNFMSDRPGFYEEFTGGARGISMSSFSSAAAGNSPLPESSTNIGGGNEDSEDHHLHRASGSTAVEREHMFEKVVTPSDVGKLNRLVIPKQHAEKYFPLDSSTNEKGLLLNFEDRNGKPWRFRYSYWNSSQSYVMTKGWSRFVKEKKLDAGDVVSFQRGVVDKDRLFIDWRRRPDAPDLLPPPIPHHFSSFQYRSSTNPWNPLFLNPLPPREYSPYQINHFPQQQYHHHQNQNQYGINYGYNTSTIVNGNPCPPGSIFYLSRPGSTTGSGGGGSGFIEAGRAQQEGVLVNQMGSISSEQMVYESVPVVQGKAAAAKRLRLFGVNMDCPIPDSDNECEMLSSNSAVPLHQYFPSSTSSPTCSSSFHNSLQLRPNYSEDQEDKGKGSMSLDLDI